MNPRQIFNMASGAALAAVSVAVVATLAGPSVAQVAPSPSIMTNAKVAILEQKPLFTTAAAPAVTASPPSTAESVRVLLVPALDTTISSPVAGRIHFIESSLGAAFGAGKVLIGFDCEEPVARLAMAKADLAGAVETHEAKVRLQGLEQASDVEVALAAAATSKARAQQALGAAQVAQCNVVAPWPGRVAKVHVRNHMSVTAGQPLLDLVRAGPLKLKLSVPSRWLSVVKPGVALDVSIDETGKAYPARVAAMNSRIDPVSQTIEIEAVMSRDHPELLAGMSGTARFAAAVR